MSFVVPGMDSKICNECHDGKFHKLCMPLQVTVQWNSFLFATNDINRFYGYEKLSVNHVICMSSIVLWNIIGYIGRQLLLQNHLCRSEIVYSVKCKNKTVTKNIHCEFFAFPIDHQKCVALIFFGNHNNQGLRKTFSHVYPPDTLWMVCSSNPLFGIRNTSPLFFNYNETIIRIVSSSSV